MITHVTPSIAPGFALVHLELEERYLYYVDAYISKIPKIQVDIRHKIAPFGKRIDMAGPAGQKTGPKPTISQSFMHLWRPS